MTRHCNAKTRAGGKCKRPAGWGTGHSGAGRCKMHGGASPSGEVAGAREDLERRAASMATAVRMEPIDALLHVVHAQAGRVKWVTATLARHEGDLFNADGRMVPIAAAHGAELKQLAIVSKLALDAGVAERRVRMAERTAAIIAAAAEDAFAELGEVATPEVRARFALAFATRLEVLEATADEDEPVALPNPV